MTDESTQSIVIEATPSVVMAVIADLSRYPEWVDAARSVKVVETDFRGRAVRAWFVVDAAYLKDSYELQYHWAEDGLCVSWSLVESTIMSFHEGAYRLEPHEQGTEVTYTVSIGLQIPMIGQFRRKAERAIMDMALKELKKRVESLESS